MVIAPPLGYPNHKNKACAVQTGLGCVLLLGMICQISGILAAVDDTNAILDQPLLGQARQVLLPTYLAQELATQVGKPIKLHTFEYLEAQGQGTSFLPRLIGFAAPNERRFFEVFTRVKGLGNRKALRAMILTPAQIAGLIASRNVSGLQKMPGIGKRLAETIIAELSGKIEGFVDPGILADSAHAGAAFEPKTNFASLAQRNLSPEHARAASEALDVLMTLGQTQAEAQRSIQRVLQAHLTDSPTNAPDESLSSESLVAMVFGQTTD